MLRLLEHPILHVHQLRLWTAGDGPAPLGPQGLGVEWVGRVGHPTSFALLGGHLDQDRDSASIEEMSTDVFPASLADRFDGVQFGLPDEYAVAVRGAVGPGVVVTIGAHGDLGSSNLAFTWVGRLLRSLLEDGVPIEDDAVWSRWESCRRDA